MKKKGFVFIFLYILVSAIWGDTFGDWKFLKTNIYGPEEGIVINGYTGSSLVVTIPETINSMPVHALSGVVESVDQNKNGIFDYNGLLYDKPTTSVIIPEGIKVISSGSFVGNMSSKLKNVILPLSVTVIYSHAFDDNPIEQITIGENVALAADGYGVSFPRNFDKFYNANNKKSGIYTFINGQWTFKESNNTISGTFSSGNGRVSLAFSDDMVLLHINGVPQNFGFFNVSGSTLYLRFGRDAEAWGWTIIDADTIRDNDGEIFKKIGSVTGTYRYSENAFITFTGNAFTGRLGTTPLSGTFAISGSKLILTRSNGVIWEWNIAAINVIRDHDGDSWRKN